MATEIRIVEYGEPQADTCKLCTGKANKRIALDNGTRRVTANLCKRCLFIPTLSLWLRLNEGGQSC